MGPASKRRWISTLLVLASGVLAAQPQDPKATTAFVNADVLAMDGGGLRRNHTLVIQAQRIVHSGPSDQVKLPDGARVIDASGKTLIPGMAEMHAHIPSASQGSDYRDRVLQLFLAYGITTVRGMLGEKSHLQLRQQIRDGEILGPRLFTSGPSLNGRSVSSPEQGAELVRQQASAGYDFIKLHPGLTSAQYAAIVAAASEHNMMLAGHVSNAVGLAATFRAGQSSIDHLDGYLRELSNTSDAQFFGFDLAQNPSLPPFDTLARKTADAKIWNVPTMALVENRFRPLAQTLKMPALAYIRPGVVRRWRNSVEELQNNPEVTPQAGQRFIQVRRGLLSALHEHGAGILLGSDAPQVFNVPGFATQQELQILVASGLSPMAALQAGTLNPARYFSATEVFGSLREGREADIVMLDANPLIDIEHALDISGVMVRGRWLDRAALDAMLAALK